MRTNTTHLAATIAALPWFDLARHDEPDPAPTPDPAADPGTQPDDDTDPDPAADPADNDPAADPPKPKDPAKPDDGLRDKGKRALDRMKADLAAEKRARQAAEAKARDYEDRDKSDLEKATSKAERLEQIATKATARAVAAEIKATARESFADPTDAAEVLMRSVDKYVDSDGEIDADAIQRDLEDLLDRKPHWAKPAPTPASATEPAAPAKTPAKPDPGQGQRPSTPPTDYRNASVEERDAYLNSIGYRFRS
ncbi:hypothetical protein [Kitasatospora cineracea]|uniref:Minor structural protein GP20 n=1 Tax=Kitasatospora cineracea TaxID=88074 RepID=A0A3N4R7E7_9ACTN|nr:hypothetical protein [Kitasatospora cineracea]RPE27289.1 hypothetical protein EDD38_7434 [Kitasatospora cineracea]